MSDICNAGKAEPCCVDNEWDHMDTWVDASRLTLDHAIPMTEREAYVEKALGDPHRFRVGRIGVKLEFAQNGVGLHALFNGFLLRQRDSLL